jgi:hypothetical protein
MDLESEFRLIEDAAQVAAFLEENDGQLTAGWTPGAELAKGDEVGVYWATMRPRSAPDERYHARLGWARYPGSAPSVKYATGIRGRLDDPKAWPSCPGYRPSSFDICAAFTMEGFQTHPEWVAQHPWPTSGNPFLWVVSTLQGDLDRKYGGRAA